MFRAILAATFISLGIAAGAQNLTPRDGWEVVPTPYDFATLVDRVGAAGQGIEIPGNRVIGLFRNDYARRMLAASIAAGIEAPIRLYVTENADGTATLSYKTPTAVFAPYADEGSTDLADLATELDAVFAAVVAVASGS